MDFDGDIIFSTNDRIISKGSYDYGVAKPLYYELGDSTSERITKNVLIEADIRGLNSKVGSYSNRSGSIYALLTKYNCDSQEYKNLYNQIVALGEVVGAEIDRIKTGLKPKLPLEWTRLQGFAEKDPDKQTDVDKGKIKHNELVPNQRAYFMQYNYDFLHKDINRLNKAYNQVSKYTYGVKFDELKAMCHNGTATDEMMKYYESYLSVYPVIDTDCVVNHISHYFEKISFDLHKQVYKDGYNVLLEYVVRKEFDMDKINRVKEIVGGYKRFLRLQVKNYNCNRRDGKKEKDKRIFNNLKNARRYYSKKLLDVCGNHRNAFDYLVVVCKSSEKIVWDLLEDYMVSKSFWRIRKDDSI